MDRIEKIAQFMLDQHKSQHNFQNLPQTLMPKNFEEASYFHISCYLQYKLQQFISSHQY